MKYRGTLITQASGSLNGKVFSHNRGGPYIRTRTIPADPATAEQVVLRDALAELAARWADTATSIQRSAWWAYSQAFPRVDRIGAARPVGAFQEFTRANIVRLQLRDTFTLTMPILYDPPTRGVSAPFGSFTAQWFPTSSLWGFQFTGDQPWRTEAGAWLAIYASPIQPAIRNYFRTPYTLVGFGSGALSPTFATAASPPAPGLPAAGQRVFFRFRHSRADGSLSESRQIIYDG